MHKHHGTIDVPLKNTKSNNFNGLSCFHSVKNGVGRASFSPQGVQLPHADTSMELAQASD